MLVLAVKAWATGAKTDELSEILNIPYQAVKRFTRHPGWHQVVRQLRGVLDEEVENKLQRNLRLSLEELEDRLENGNKHVNKKGEEERRPLSAADLSTIAATLFDKRTTARKMVDGIPDEPTDIKKSLDDIANILRKHNSFASHVPQTIDIEPDSAEEAA